jgi:hypothetical protein
MNSRPQEDMCRGCIHEQKNYSGQIQSQKHVNVFQNKSALTDTRCMCARARFQFIQGRHKIRFQRLEHNECMTTYNSVVTILFKITNLCTLSIT